MALQRKIELTHREDTKIFFSREMLFLSFYVSL